MRACRRPEQLALAGLKDAGALKCPMCSNAGKAKPKVRWDMHAPDHGTVYVFHLCPFICHSATSVDLLIAMLPAGCKPTRGVTWGRRVMFSRAAMEGVPWIACLTRTELDVLDLIKSMPCA